MNKLIEILLVSSFFGNLAAGFIGPIYAVFVEQVGGDLVTAGLAYAIFAIVSGVLLVLLGKWEDHVNHKENLLVVSRILSIAGFAGYLFVHSPEQLFIVQIVLGVSLALGAPAFDSIYYKNVDKKDSAFEWGAWEGVYQIALGVSALIGGYIAQNFGFNILFIFMVIFGFFSLCATLALVLERKSAKARKPAPRHKK
jgi:MFS family permease